MDTLTQAGLITLDQVGWIIALMLGAFVLDMWMQIKDLRDLCKRERLYQRAEATAKCKLALEELGYKTP